MQKYKYLAGKIENLTDLRNRFAEILNEIQNKNIFAIQDEITAEYRMIFNELKEKDTNPFTESEESIHDYDIQTDRRILEKIIELSDLKDLRIDVVGSWIWITKAQAEPYEKKVEEMGFKYSKKRKRWYWTARPMKKKYKPIGTLGDIKKVYGT